MITLIFVLLGITMYAGSCKFAYFGLTKVNRPQITKLTCAVYHGSYGSHSTACIRGIDTVASRKLRVFWSFFGPVVTPFLLLYWVIVYKAPLTSQELQERREQLQKEIRQAERDLASTRNNLPPDGYQYAPGGALSARTRNNRHS